MDYKNDFLEDTPCKTTENKSIQENPAGMNTDKENFDDSYPADYDPTLNGIDGWLILIIISMFSSIMFAATDIMGYIKYIGVDAHYNWIFVSLIVNCVISITLCALLLIFIFTRNIFFRKLLIILFSKSLLVIILIVFYKSGIGSDISSFMSDIIGTIIGVAIWITYAYRSKRVKNTFLYSKIYKMPENEDWGRRL